MREPICSVSSPWCFLFPISCLLFLKCPVCFLVVFGGLGCLCCGPVYLCGSKQKKASFALKTKCLGMGLSSTEWLCKMEKRSVSLSCMLKTRHEERVSSSLPQLGTYIIAMPHVHCVSASTLSSLMGSLVHVRLFFFGFLLTFFFFS